MNKCPACNGEGSAVVDTHNVGSDYIDRYESCELCEGTGKCLHRRLKEVSYGPLKCLDCGQYWEFNREEQCYMGQRDPTPKPSTTDNPTDTTTTKATASTYKTDTIGDTEKEIKPGDLVVVAHWGDFDLADGTFLGRFSHQKDGYYYIGALNRGFKHIRKVEEPESQEPVSKEEE